MWVCDGCKLLVTLEVAEPQIDDDGIYFIARSATGGTNSVPVPALIPMTRTSLRRFTDNGQGLAPAIGPHLRHTLNLQSALKAKASTIDCCSEVG
jgi:hypothetical protein